ncbi:MAG: dihydroorotate dehydrogenase-like protein [Bacteroidales bacterium]|nr:dihydroorotate dehydrogenase-like protein [Bacteroidales bacterium]
MDISTKFMGCNISSPIIAGSCGKTANLDNIKQFEDCGVGAVILKSLFEEQISQEANNHMRLMQNAGEMIEAYTYIAEHTKHDNIEKYLNLIRSAKESTRIPIIASVNCVSASEWLQFASSIQNAGADGLELNMFILPTSINMSSEEVEQVYEDTVQMLRRVITIPISLKISYYSAALAKFCQKLSWMGIANLSIFNRFIEHDIDIMEEATKPVNIFSTENELYHTIRWTAILSKLINCPLTAGGGVHKEEDVVKLLLSGANTIQVASALYDQGAEFITKANTFLKQWMQEKNYHKLSDFRGRLAIDKNDKASTFYRVQYMKYFSGIE